MLRRYSQVLVNMLFASDLVLTVLSAALAYALRYHSPLAELVHVRGDDAPAVAEMLLVLMGALPVAALAYEGAGLYQPRRVGTQVRELFDITRATAIVIIVLITANFFLRANDLSRGLLVVFLCTNVLVLGISRGIARQLLRRARRRGWNQRSVVIVGAGRLGQKLADRIEENPWTGFRAIGYVDPRAERQGRTFHGARVLGGLDDLPDIVEQREVDQVFVALPFKLQEHLPAVLDSLAELHVDVRVVPDTISFVTMRGSVDDFAGMPIINLRESPLYGWNRLAKRMMDAVLSFLLLLAFSPVLVAVALAVRLSSPGPILYRQERMGLDGELFQMLKFRTMRTDAERETGAVWAKEDDPRRTRLGTFLRKTSLDELPQLWNVLRGQMSLVGPRPERPVFIAEFKQTIPRYMLRHKVKAGMTGWAQINGWRGNTSLRKRIQYDLDYIERWSLVFDLKILFLTIFRGFVAPNAY